MLEHKIDFMVLVTATNANPNGDPLNGNRPRENSGYGEITDVCIKRKLRNRLQDMGEEILIVSDDYRKPDDKFDSIHARVDSVPALKEIYNSMNAKSKKKGKEEKGKKSKVELEDNFRKTACEKWIDVRSFGQVFALKSKAKNDESDSQDKDNSVSIGVRGPVTFQPAFSVNIVDIITTKITKSTNNESEDKKGKDTMGEKHRVAFGLYVINGSINCQLADKTGFSADDAAKIKEALTTLFENDASSARPEGSMEVCRVYWWEHDCRTPKVSSAKIHRSVKIKLKDGIKQPSCFNDYEITVEDTGVKPEIIELV